MISEQGIFVCGSSINPIGSNFDWKQSIEVPNLFFSYRNDKFNEWQIFLHCINATCSGSHVSRVVDRTYHKIKICKCKKRKKKRKKIQHNENLESTEFSHVRTRGLFVCWKPKGFSVFYVALIIFYYFN